MSHPPLAKPVPQANHAGWAIRARVRNFDPYQWG